MELSLSSHSKKSSLYSSSMGLETVLSMELRVFVKELIKWIDYFLFDIYFYWRFGIYPLDITYFASDRTIIKNKRNRTFKNVLDPLFNPQEG